MSTVDRFEAPAHLRNAHLQTILNSQGPRRWRARGLRRNLRSEALILTAADGTRLSAQLDRARGESASSLVVMIHGWEGSNTSSYMITTAARLLAQGHDVLRLNLRDHGDSHHLNRELFNSTRSPEVASALAGFLREKSYHDNHLVGFSLGGSFALRIAADTGQDLGLSTCVAICPPVDPARVMQALNTGFFVYERYFFRRWRSSLQRKLEFFPELGYAEDLARARSLDDLNELFVPQYTAYDRVEDYFRAYSLYDERLAGLAVPTHIIASHDDPIIPADDFARITPNPCLHIDISPHGGHCGFIETLGARSWVEARIGEILSPA